MTIIIYSLVPRLPNLLNVSACNIEKLGWAWGRGYIFGCGEYSSPAKGGSSSQPSMSDHPLKLAIEFKLNNVVLAVSDVAEWFELGLQLGLPSATLRLIAADPNIRDIKSQRLAMLSEWFKYDSAASWEKLAAALAAIGENVVAANVRSQSQVMKGAATKGPALNEDNKTCTLLLYI